MLKLVLRISRLNIPYVEQVSWYSAWLKPSRTMSGPEVSPVDAEKSFINPEVQQLLVELTGMDLEGKVFRTRRTTIQQRSHFALMTYERLDETMEKMRREAQRFLSFVPLKEPRSEEVTVLAKDDDIIGFDDSKFVFTDITFDATDHDRTVVVREVDEPNRPVFPPPVFEDPYLQDALARKEHEFVLDWACWFYEPDDPAYVKLVQCVFDRTVESNDFEVLHSTRHFATLVFYLALNGNIPPLLNYFGGRGRIRDCANLVRLQKRLLPNWRFAINSSDTDLKIVTDFVKQNNRFRDSLKDLIAFLKDGVVLSSTSPKDDASSSAKTTPKTTVHADNIGDSSGPLGDLSEQYDVKLIKSEEGADETSKQESRKKPSWTL
ncbi:Mitochondrial 28S ribosomal protein S22 [Parelaphostrongylus tenuis]|uniref:Mitochondrial 28S ribosomal protein S22 n=1 Tax=Parelaphostrongylus tenuis TaxID=148309 RepID=A0AAD5QBR1_PARTN|nr:Mitochondrial 28S ribosomal protein S22 [Parelaphostrongylus tenuis]